MRDIKVCTTLGLIVALMIISTTEADMNEMGSETRSEMREKIPLWVYQNLSKITSVEEFLKVMAVHPDSEEEKVDTISQGSFNAQQLEILAGRVTTPDTCSPKHTSMKIPVPPGYDQMWPGCVALNQCGGCGCAVDMLECVPDKEEEVEIQVMGLKYAKEGQFFFDMNVPVKLREAVSCTCRCRVQEHHCLSGKQEYNEHDCMCRCLNEADVHCPEYKIWDASVCECVCPRQTYGSCMLEEYFDHDTCSCVMPSSFIKDLSSKEQCDGLHCRHGYSPRIVNGVCRCQVSQMHGHQAGSLIQQGSLPEVENVEPERKPAARPEVRPAARPQRPDAEERPTRPVASGTRPQRPQRPHRPGRQRPGTPLRTTGTAIAGAGKK